MTSTIEVDLTSTAYNIDPLCSTLATVANLDFDTTLPNNSWVEIVGGSGFNISTNTNSSYVNVEPNSV